MQRRTWIWLLTIPFLALLLTTPALGEDKPVDPVPVDAEDAAKSDDPGPANAPVGGSGLIPAPSGPSGMVYVPGGEAIIGTAPRELAKLTAGRGPSVITILRYETPRWTKQVPGYFMDEGEVTNAQYSAFLQQSEAVVYKLATGAHTNLDEIAAHLVELTAAARKDRNQRVWDQLYYANWERIIESLSESQKKKFVVRTPGGEIDHEETARKLRFEPLPRKLELTFITRQPPEYWRGMVPHDEILNHPVRDVSYIDARRFAEWAGKHVPTEVEWEYAGRGPKALAFPWGPDLPESKAEQMLRGNWKAHFIDARYMPRTVEVDDIVGGRSWCGTLHQVGNVAEWTSSFFAKYPGSTASGNYDSSIGRVMVIRGGHAATQASLALRLGARNFVGNGPKASPHPINRFTWVGFRTAWYPRAGQNHLEPTLVRATRARRARMSRLDLDGFAGAVTETFALEGAQVENGVHVLGPSAVVLFVPMKKILWFNERVSDEWEEKSYMKGRFSTTANFNKRSKETPEPRLILGVLHADAPLERIWVRKPVKPNQPRRGGRRRNMRAPETIKGKLSAGTYLVTYWHERIALTDASLQFQGFVGPARKKDNPALTVHKGSDDEPLPPTAMDFDPLADEAKFTFSIPMGGKRNPPEMHIKAKLDLNFELASLDSLGSDWRQGVQFQGKDLVLPDADKCELPKPEEIEVPEDEPVIPDDADDADDANDDEVEDAEGEGGEDAPEKEGDKPSDEPADEPGKDAPGKEEPKPEDPPAGGDK